MRSSQDPVHSTWHAAPPAAHLQHCASRQRRHPLLLDRRPVSAGKQAALRLRQRVCQPRPLPLLERRVAGGRAVDDELVAGRAAAPATGAGVFDFQPQLQALAGPDAKTGQVDVLSTSSLP